MKKSGMGEKFNIKMNFWKKKKCMKNSIKSVKKHNRKHLQYIKSGRQNIIYLSKPKNINLDINKKLKVIISTTSRTQRGSRNEI